MVFVYLYGCEIFWIPLYIRKIKLKDFAKRYGGIGVASHLPHFA